VKVLGYCIVACAVVVQIAVYGSLQQMFKNPPSNDLLNLSMILLSIIQFVIFILFLKFMIQEWND
jgi:uncharacterized membrane protein